MGSIVAGPGFRNGNTGLQDPNNPFVAAGSPALCLEFDQATGEQLTAIQLCTQPINTTQLANFNDPRWGNVTNEDIWSYKSQILAQQAFLLEQCAQDLANSVHNGINRPAWASQIAAALPLIQAAQQAAKSMCNVVTASHPN